MESTDPFICLALALHGTSSLAEVRFMRHRGSDRAPKTASNAAKSRKTAGRATGQGGQYVECLPDLRSVTDLRRRAENTILAPENCCFAACASGAAPNPPPDRRCFSRLFTECPASSRGDVRQRLGCRIHHGRRSVAPRTDDGDLAGAVARGMAGAPRKQPLARGDARAFVQWPACRSMPRSRGSAVPARENDPFESLTGAGGARYQITRLKHRIG